MNDEEKPQKIELSDETMDKLVAKLTEGLAESLSKVLLNQVADQAAKSVGSFVLDKVSTFVGIALLGLYYFYGDKFK